MSAIQKTLAAIFATIGTIGGAVWVCMSIIDRNDAHVREQARIELTIQGIQKDFEKLDSREWKDWSQLNDDTKALRGELAVIREKLLTLELKPK